MIDYVLATTSYAAAIISVEAVADVPWGPHFGIRVKYRTNTADIKVPEIVRPMSIAKAVEEMEGRGWVEDNPERATDHNVGGGQEHDEVHCRRLP